MALRKASCYSLKYTVPFTRKSKVAQKSYIKTVPNTKLTKMRMGDIIGFKAGKLKTVMKVQTRHRVQLRDNALEAARQYLNRFLTEKLGKEFYLEVKPYPHHILRENKMLTGAGADRMQTGMALAYGKSVGRACLMAPGDTIFIIGVNGQKNEAYTRELINSVKARLPCTIHVETIYAKK